MSQLTSVLLAFICFFAISNVVSSHHGRPHADQGEYYTMGASYPENFNFFDLELLKGVCESREGNVLISPASVKTLLGLLLEGAAENTAEQLRHTLRLDNENLATAQLHKFQLSLKPDGLSDTSLTLANRAFLTDKAMLKSHYREVLRNNYNADVELLNMAKSQEAVDTINRWVNNNTNGLIPKLVEEGSIDQNTLLVLTNAIYFHAVWETAFEPRNTNAAQCFKAGSTCYPIRMMEVVGYFRYADRDFGQILEMDYKDKRYSMVVVLPRQENGVDSLVRDLPFLGLNSILSNLSKSEVWVTLPRFALEFESDLVPDLKELGVKDVFEQTSNLSEMVAGKSPMVSKVFHKAKIQVTEEGAAAGAASGALVVPLMGSTLPHFAATHPFLFFIRDVQTNGFLFAGRLSVPQDFENAAPYQPRPSSSQPSTSSPPRPSSSSTNLPARPPPSYYAHSTSNSPQTSTPAESTETTPGGIPLKHKNRRQ